MTKHKAYVSSDSRGAVTRAYCDAARAIFFTITRYPRGVYVERIADRCGLRSLTTYFPEEPTPTRYVRAVYPDDYPDDAPGLPDTYGKLPRLAGPKGSIPG